MHVEKLHGLTFIRPDTTANEVCLYNIEKQEDVWSANQVWIAYR